ncbi:MAG: hypothetical protein ACT4NV_06480 [Rhodoferax sp.]
MPTQTEPLQRIYHQTPNAGAFMVHALLRGGRQRAPGAALDLQWHGARWRKEQLQAVHAMTGLPMGESYLLLLPQVLGFRLVMATLTDRAFALPIWSALQVRNRLRLHQPYAPDQAMELRARTTGWRQLAKGLETDVRLELGQHGRVAWESVSTFYYRGAGVRDAGHWEPPAAPGVPAPVVAQWRGADGGGWAFGALTGDYNGVHWSRRYARMFGFAQPFHHPGRVLGQCLAQWQGVHAAVAGAQQSLDVWVRGPVPYGVPLALHGQGQPQQPGGAVLGLCHPGDPRAALVVRWQQGAV